jgi:hypothetical protein
MPGSCVQNWDLERLTVTKQDQQTLGHSKAKSLGWLFEFDHPAPALFCSVYFGIR